MTSSKLEQLLKQQEQLKARIADERAKERKQERQADNRRKMLTGIALQEAVKAGTVNPEWVNQLLDTYITTQRDREFLGLAAPAQQPKPEQEPQPEPEAQPEPESDQLTGPV